MTVKYDPSSREAAEALLRRIGVGPTDDAVWEVYDALGACARYGAQYNNDELLADNNEHAIQCPRCGRALLRIHITLHADASVPGREFVGQCPTCMARRGDEEE
jgi:hypothetical protein